MQADRPGGLNAAERQAPILPDVLAPGLDVVFCGMAAGDVSAAVGAPYAGPGNKFWRVLHEVGLTPRRLEPSEFRSLPELGIGLTDIVKTASGRDHVIPAAHYDPEGLERKVRQFEPRLLAFVGKRAAQRFFGGQVGYGRQPATIGTTDVYVLPSTSGAASGFWDVSHWHALAAAVRARRSGPS